MEKNIPRGINVHTTTYNQINIFKNKIIYILSEKWKYHKT